MTDKELLELAAKAAGIEIDWSVFLDNGSHKIYRVVNTRNYWNPLVSDGDALRLAVKLGLSIGLYTDPDETWCSVGINHNVKEPHGIDPYAATRRAITRAAAAIGEKML